MNPIIDRILEQLGDSSLLDRLHDLPKSDLNSLLLKLFQMQAEKATPTETLKRYRTNRFCVPSMIDPIEYHRLEVELLLLAQELEINGLLLSPAALLTSCSAFGCVDQNNVVSGLRGTEILSDPTNMIAVIVADKLKHKELDNQVPVHYATTARVLRSQQFPDIPGFYAHFGVFCMVSSGKDTGSYVCEKALFHKQLTYYRKLLLDRYKAQLSVVLRKRAGYLDSDGFWDSMIALIKTELPDVPLSFDVENKSNHYYKGINFKLYMNKNGEQVEIGDGGFVDWIQTMTGNKKERCLISGIGIERIKNGIEEV